MYGVSIRRSRIGHAPCIRICLGDRILAVGIVDSNSRLRVYAEGLFHNGTAAIIRLGCHQQRIVACMQGICLDCQRISSLVVATCYKRTSKFEFVLVLRCISHREGHIDSGHLVLADIGDVVNGYLRLFQYLDGLDSRSRVVALVGREAIDSQRIRTIGQSCGIQRQCAACRSLNLALQTRCQCTGLGERI